MNASNQPLDEGMRQGYVWYGFDLMDLQKPEIGLPAVETEQGVIIGAQ